MPLTSVELTAALSTLERRFPFSFSGIGSRREKSDVCGCFLVTLVCKSISCCFTATAQDVTPVGKYTTQDMWVGFKEALRASPNNLTTQNILNESIFSLLF